jgi:hypothetical protein
LTEGGLVIALQSSWSDSASDGAVEKVVSYAAGSSVPYAVDEHTGAGYKQIPERVELVLVPNPPPP